MAIPMPPSGRAEPTLFYVIKQMELAVRAQLDALLRPAGITVPQYTALTVLERRDGLTAAELARNSFVTAQSMADVVTALEQRGFIVRRVDPAHRRRLTISLTDGGRQLLDGLRESVAALEARMTAGLSPPQVCELTSYLHCCRAALADGPPH